MSADCARTIRCRWHLSDNASERVKHGETRHCECHDTSDSRVPDRNQPVDRAMLLFTPSCSQYGIEAIRKYGPIGGLWRTAWRIMRCNPFCKGGHDPP